MRGARQPAIQPQASESQTAFRKLSRHRRVKVAKTAHTTLVKADQWGRGASTSSDLGKALEAALKAFHTKRAAKK